MTTPEPRRGAPTTRTHLVRCHCCLQRLTCAVPRARIVTFNGPEVGMGGLAEVDSESATQIAAPQSKGRPRRDAVLSWRPRLPAPPCGLGG